MNAVVTGLNPVMQEARNSLGRFLHWWGHELLGVLPAGLRRLVARERSRLMLDLDGAEVHLRLAVGEGEIRDLGRIRLDERDAEVQVKGLLGGPAGRVEEIVVRLPDPQVLRKMVVMPAATAENLREVLAFEMDRHTPFKAEQVHYDFRIVATDPDRRNLRVELAVVPRKRLDDLVGRLAEVGLVPDRVGVVDGDDVSSAGRTRARPLNLLPADRRGQRTGGGGWLLTVLGIVVVGLAGVAVALPLVQKERLLAELRRDVAAAQAEAHSAETLQSELEKSIAEVTFLARKKGELPAVIDVVEELTRILPDDSWLSRLELRGETVKIQGESPASSALVPVIEDSPMFHDASFAAPVTQNPKSGAERFVITTQLARKDGS